jgi:deoxyribonuclease IV
MCRAPVGDGANRRRRGESDKVLIGAHVSTAGGLATAVGRGSDLGCEAIQIFNQSPRAWRPTAYGDDDHRAFRDERSASGIESVAIHAIYLINGASTDPQIERKSHASLVAALRLGDAIGADGVVLHAGARKGKPHAASMRRAGKAISTALSESDRCPLLLENTAGTQGPLGRNFDELAELIELAGGGGRLGVCLDSCHLLASGFEVREAEPLGLLIDELDAKIGLERLRLLHVNDSKIPLGGNRDQHAVLGEGELGNRGIGVFLSEPRFDGLPAVIETGVDGGAPARADVRKARRLRREGIRRRAGR